MHEQSETVERDGKFFNVYGAATPGAGKVLPGEPAYNTLKEAVTAAKNRSERYGREHNPEGNNMVAPSQSDDVKAAQYRKEAAAAQLPTPTPAERAAMMAQKVEADRAAKETKASTTKTGMGDKLFAKGGSIRGDGIAQRGKTKGRMV